MRDDLPTGTVTFLFTDIEGSTKLLHELGADAYADALAEHRRIVRDACAAEGGVEVDTQGDAFFFAFASAPGAAAAAQAMTEALAPGRIHLRIGLHTGTPVVTDEGYVGADVHRAARIAAAGHGSQVLLAATTAALVPPDDLIDLGEHRFKDLATPEHVYQLGTGGFPPLKSLFRANLPLAANPLVGRKKELADVLRFLLDDSRAVTVTGPGGVGKTRFALAVATEAADAFPDGVWFVPLAPLRDPNLVLPTVAEVIGASGDLARHIGDDKSLLFLDNVEHLVDAAPALAALVAECPRLRLIATSREALRIAFEREYPLSPLAESPSVELFRQRASAVAPDVEIEYGIATEICDRLDRLPLAIELAAARCKALSPAQVLERLTDLLDLLKGGRDTDPRQQTLRATIEWSFRLLTAGEQRLFSRLSVFRGGCTLEAAEAVCDAGLDTLHSLVEKSLLRFSNERYWMLETIREYARERLDEAGERADYDLRHARYFLARLEQAFEARTGPCRDEVLAWYAAEVDNLRATLDRLTESAPDDAARATHMLFMFWRSVGVLEFAEATHRLESLLPLQLTDDLRAETLARIAENQEVRGDLDVATATAAEVLRLSTPGTYARIVGLGITASSEARRGNVEEAIRLSRLAIEDAPRVAEVRISMRGELATLLVQVGRRAEARTELHDAIGEARENGLLMNEQWGTGQLGFIDLLDADYEAARDALATVLSHARRLAHYPFTVFALECLGFAYLGLDDRRAARVTFGEVLELGISRSGRTVLPEVALALDGIAFAVDPGDFRDGARLAGAVAKLREEAGGLRSNLWPLDEEIVARFAQPLIDALGREDYESARAAGAALGLDETLELARSLAAS